MKTAPLEQGVYPTKRATRMNDPNNTTQIDGEPLTFHHHIWHAFCLKAETLQTYKEAIRLVAEAPSPTALGYDYYANLSYFLQFFIAPPASSYAEKANYLRLVRHLATDHTLEQEAMSRIEGKLRYAMELQSDHPIVKTDVEYLAQGGFYG